MERVARRTGAQTRAQAQRVALSLFSTQGYDTTSMRQIADELGITKASLYYHFTGKEDIVRATVSDRAAEAQELVEWVRSQPRTADLLERTVLRWIDSFSVDKLRGLRFVGANPLLMRRLAPGGARIGDGLSELVAELVHGRDSVHELQVRMALLSINAAVSAAAGDEFADEDVVAAARQAALAVVRGLGTTTGM